MIKELAKILSKRDIAYLLEVSYGALNGKNKNEFESIALKLQELLNVNVIVLGYIYGSPFDAKLMDNLSIGLSDEYIINCMSKHYYQSDPIILRAFQSGEIINVDEHYKNYPTMKMSPLFSLGEELNLNFNSFLYVLKNFDDSKLLSFGGMNGNEPFGKRMRLIIEYSAPFIALFFDKLSKISEIGTLHSLTQRELEILKWLKDGKSTWEISMILNIAECTVNFHITNIMRKLNATKRTQAVAIALKSGLIEF